MGTVHSDLIELGYHFTRSDIFTPVPINHFKPLLVNQKGWVLSVNAGIILHWD